MKNAADKSPSPLFAYSLTHRMVVWVVLGVFSSPLFFYLLFLVGPFHIQSALLLFLALMPVLFLIHDWRHRVRKALFYEEHFRVFGRGLEKELKYDQIQRVSTLKGYGLVNLFLAIKDEEKPLNLEWIPKSREMKTDLYTWLKQKTNANS